MKRQNMRRREEWFDDESFWRATYPFLSTPEKLDGTGDEIDRLLGKRSWKTPASKRVSTAASRETPTRRAHAD
jgi:hypothetical protein